MKRSCYKLSQCSVYLYAPHLLAPDEKQVVKEKSKDELYRVYMQDSLFIQK
jgi:hypothetical protein